MSSVTEVSKILNLDITRIPEDKISSAKKEVGNFLVEEILRAVGGGTSPVSGEYWKKLKKEYADEFKGGDRTPTMQLFGDLLDSLEVKTSGLADNQIKIGHFEDSEQAPKADGHNQHSIEAKLWAISKEFPKRRYIPQDNQNFKSSIMNGVSEILDGYRLTEDEVARDKVRLDSSISEVDDTLPDEFIRVDIGNIFSDDVIEALILDVQRRRK